MYPIGCCGGGGAGVRDLDDGSDGGGGGREGGGVAAGVLVVFLCGWPVFLVRFVEEWPGKALPAGLFDGCLARKERMARGVGRRRDLQH